MVMRRAIIFTMILVLALAGAALAAGPKVPKTVCLQIAGPGGFILSMAIKTAGTVKKGSGPVKFYSINGEFNNVGVVSTPVVGTGHMNGNIFHFSASGTGFLSGSGNLVYCMEAEWDLTNTAPQTMHFRILRDGGDSSFDHTFIVGVCDADIIPYGAYDDTDKDPLTRMAK
jgi:hypothetical protein